MRYGTGIEAIQVNHDALASVCKALGHPARVQIIRLLAGQEECRGADVFAELPLAQSTVSQHIAKLKDAGVIRSTPRGTSMVYCLESSVVALAAEQLAQISEKARQCGTIAKGDCS
jgi:DNA-binding transcriptional ArsR family regulator